MNWYKLAEGITFTPDQFQAMTYEEKLALAKNKSITQETQSMFFTPTYWNKGHILQSLAENTSISSQTQSMIFTYCVGKSGTTNLRYSQAANYDILQNLAANTSISPEVQLLCFTQEYWGSHGILSHLAANTSISPELKLLFFTQDYGGGWVALHELAQNRSISPQTKLLFFTQEYRDKENILNILFKNPSFLKGLTLEEMREFKKTKEFRLPCYKKRINDVKEKILL